MEKTLNFGIRARLGGAFAVVAGLLCACGLISFIAFSQFGSSVDTIADQRFPRIEASLKLVLEGERIAATGATLAQATNADMRKDANAALAHGIQQATALAAILRSSDGAGMPTDLVASGIEKLSGILRGVDKLVGETIERHAKLVEVGATATRLGEEFSAALQPLVSEQRNGLVGHIAVLNSASSSAERKLAAENNIRQVADTMRALGRMSAASATLQSAFFQLPGTYDAAILARLAQTIKREIDTLASALDDLDQRTAQAIEPFVERWEKIVKSDPVGIQRQQLEALIARTKLAAAGVAAAAELAGAIDEGVASAKRDVADAANSARSLVGTSKIVLAFVIAAGTGISLLIGWFYVGHNVAGRLLGIASAMRRLADGELNVDLPASGSDEIGAMVDALLVFKNNAERMRALEAEQDQAKRRLESDKREAALKLAEEFERTVTGIVDRVSHFASQTWTSAQALVSSARNSTDLSRSVSERIDSSLGNAQTVASASEELAASIAEITRQVSQSTLVSGRAVKVADDANKVVEGLSANAQQIGDVVKMIQEIANQTNLLALNATIEAARAGEAGKGFAVVASEVKGLAAQTAQATDQITAQIAEVQGVTKQVVDAIRGIGATITEIDGVSSAIASAVEQQGATTREIAGSIQLVAAGTRDAAADTAQAQRAATETGDAAGKVLSASDELNQIAGELRRQIDTFLDGLKAA